MDHCDWCNLSEEDKQFQLYESASWSVFLSDEQDYIGRCILVLKRHCGSLSELSDDEWDELRDLIRKVEACLKAVLGAALCNWSCLMNSFHKEPAPDPHLHIHVRPRYDHPIVLNGRTYPDGEFGHHYALNKNAAMPAMDKEEVFSLLKGWLDRQVRQGKEADMIRRAGIEEAGEVAGLALRLWPDHGAEEMEAEFRRLVTDEEAACFVRYVGGRPVAFAQCQLRHDYVEGTESSPVGYLEGIFVLEEHRKNGYAAELLSECEKWAKEKGCTEFASDCELGNADSFRFHVSLGFEEANRIICFRKDL